MYKRQTHGLHLWTAPPLSDSGQAGLLGRLVRDARVAFCSRQEIASGRCQNSLVLQPLVPEPLLYEGRKLNIRSLHLLLPGRNGSATRLFHDYGQWMVAGSRLDESGRDAHIVNSAGRVGADSDARGFLVPPGPGAGGASLAVGLGGGAAATYAAANQFRRRS